jgi:hypothetical protein
MPVKSEKQRRFMEAVRHSPEFAKKAGVSKAVAEKFVGPKAHAEGGTVKAASLKKVFAGKETPAEERKEKVAAKKAGMSYAAAERKFEPGKHKMAKGGGVESKGKAPAKTVKMMRGGSCK